MKNKISSLNTFLVINSPKKENTNIKQNYHQYSYSYGKIFKESNNYKYFLKDLIIYENNNVKNKEYFKRSKTVKLKKINFYEKNEKYNNIKRPYYRKIYSNEYIKFENEINKIPHYIKKYKEDEITFTKNKIIPEIKWQNYDNDVLTSEEQKKAAIKKEIKNLGETIIRIQNNVNFFKYNVSMYKLSQKYPKIKN